MAAFGDLYPLKRYFFAWVYPGKGACLWKNVSIQVEAGIITDLVQEANPKDHHDEVYDDGVAMPLFYNMHSHLELYDVKPHYKGSDFVSWVQSLRMQTLGWNQSHYFKGAKQALAKAFQTGTGFILDHSNTGVTAQLETPIPIWALYEVLGQKAEVGTKNIESALQYLNQIPMENIRLGVTLHAPYSAGKSILEWASTQGFNPLSMHLEESLQEHELYALAQGSMRTFLDELNPDHAFITPQKSGLEYIKTQGLLQTNAVFVHGNYLNSTDAVVLQNHKVSLVHCPSSHQFFQHQDFAWEYWFANLNLCLGTDSATTGTDYSLWSELHILGRNSKVPWWQALQSVLYNGAKATNFYYGSGVWGVNEPFGAQWVPLTRDQLHHLVKPARVHRING
jgi:cytosine/adenosine deaminase-related metal-dependent hydrolase